MNLIELPQREKRIQITQRVERMQMPLPQRSERIQLTQSCAESLHATEDKESINTTEGGENAMPLTQRLKRMQLPQSEKRIQ